MYLPCYEVLIQAVSRGAKQNSGVLGRYSNRLFHSCLLAILLANRFFAPAVGSHSAPANLWKIREISILPGVFSDLRAICQQNCQQKDSEAASNNGHNGLGQLDFPWKSSSHIDQNRAMQPDGPKPESFRPLIRNAHGVRDWEHFLNS